MLIASCRDVSKRVVLVHMLAISLFCGHGAVVAAQTADDVRKFAETLAQTSREDEQERLLRANRELVND